MLHRRQVIPQYLIGALPAKGPHGKVVVIPAVINLELPGKVLEGIEGMGGIEPFIVFPVAALHLPVVPWGKGPDPLVSDPVLPQMCLKEGGLVPVGGKTVGELWPVVRLDALNGKGEGFHQVFQEEGGGIGAVFLKSLYEAPPGVLVNGGILEELLANDFTVHKAGRRDEFDIHLDALARVVHLLIRLGDILGIGRVDSHDALFFEETVKPGDGAGIAVLHELDPKYHEPCVRVTLAHIGDQLDFLRGMLVGVVVGPAGAFTQGVNGAVEAPLPAVNILPVRFVLKGSFGNPVFVSILNK